jgi:hypothetical protein
LYVTRRVDWSGRNDWKLPHWLWWGNKLSQQWVLSSYFKWFEERVSFAKRAQEMLNLRSVLFESLIKAYEAMLQRWAQTSKYLHKNLFYIKFLRFFN